MAQKIYKTDLDECKLFAGIFHNTCTTGTVADNVAVLAGEEVACTATGPYCVDSGTRAANT